MLRQLFNFEKQKKHIRVGIIGAGAMGAGIIYQVEKTPGMKVSFIGDINIELAIKTAEDCKQKYRVINSQKDIDTLSDDEVAISDDCFELMQNPGKIPYDVFVESTNSISDAAKYSLIAIKNRAHVVFMNAEVDLWLGRYLKHEADKMGVVVTSDAGDQHGVLIRLLEEVKLMNLRPVQLGNIKGFLNKYATAEDLKEEAAKRNLNPIQCCSYTDGTKLNIEMAILANATGMTPIKPGMEGPKVKHVNNALDHFDFSKYQPQGHVDYVLGAEPGGGVYIIAHEDSEFQIPYLKYYKLGNGPYYVIYKHYHLCHIETPIAIFNAAVKQQAILNHWAGYVCDVFAYAKKDLKPGEKIHYAIGGEHFYGMIDNVDNKLTKAKSLSPNDKVPIGIMEEEGKLLTEIIRPVKKDQAITFADVNIPNTYLFDLFKKQLAL